MENLSQCSMTNTGYFNATKDIPALVLYSHLPLIIISITIALLIIIKGRKVLSNQILLIILIPFSLWVIFSLVFWACDRGDIIMTVWAFTLLVEPLIYIGGLYLIQVLIEERDISFYQKLTLAILYLPILVFLPSRLTLSGFNIITCMSVEGPVALYYSYIIEIIYTCWIIFYVSKQFIESKNPINKKKVVLLSLGIVLFLLAFSCGNMVGSFTNDWKLGELGLLGMPVFLIFLIYSTIKFNLFNLKLVNRNLLVFTLWILIGSLITITDANTSHIITIITFIISIILGILLIQIGKQEQDNLEKIESLALSLKSFNSSLSDKVAEQTQEINKSFELEKKARRELEKLSETKDTFISIAQHNLRVPITNINNRLNEIISGKYVKIETDAQKTLEEALVSVQHLTDIADDFKNIAKMKTGSQILNLSKLSLLPSLEKILKELEIDITSMDLSVTYLKDIADWPEIKVDANKIREVLLVIIENAIRYNTSEGSIKIETEFDDDQFKITIKNTGVGITTEEKNNLFEKTFYRSKRVQNKNPTGMGIGLSVSRSIVEAHHGSLTINSEGENMGARVIITIPFDFLKSLVK